MRYLWKIFLSFVALACLILPFVDNTDYGTWKEQDSYLIETVKP